MIAFDNSYSRLPEHFFRPAKPAAAAQPQLIRYNQALADQLGIALDAGDTVRLAQIFSGQILPVGAEPIAMAYSGHQFGHFNPQLGDGRALLLGEVIDQEGRRRDIQLKGAGPTAFSRNGDGLAALGPVLREYIVSEAMAALGIPTTRALAAVLTGEPVIRETVLGRVHAGCRQPYPRRDVPVFRRARRYRWGEDARRSCDRPALSRGLRF